MNRALWTARCKSGYTFDGRACARPTPRGVLVCSDCQTAVAVPAAPRPLAGLLVAVLALLGVR